MDTKIFPTEDEVDGQTRLAQLRQFISGGSLTSEEHRYIKILLSGAHIDIIGELPIELVSQIAELLDLHHFVACLAVSRRWRDKLLSAPVMSSMTNKFCPSLGQISGDSQLDTDKCLKVLHKIGRSRWWCFQSSIMKNFSWEQESYFKPDPVYHGNVGDLSLFYAQFDNSSGPEAETRAYLNALYSCGKIAWLAKSRIVIVDNLWSRTRKVFAPPSGPLVVPALGLLALGNRLVVASMDRLLIAWDHVSNVYLEKKFPGSIKHATTEGSKVAVILFSGDIFIWEFGGKLSTLATDSVVKHRSSLDIKPQRSWKANLRVILHPSSNDTLFLASAYTEYVESKAVLKRVVYEFKDTNHVNTFEFGIPAKVYNMMDLDGVGVQIRKVLPYRRDIIGFCEPYARADPRPITPCETFVEFDIYDRRFSARTDEEFDCQKFGWPTMMEEVDLDFLVRFNNNCFLAYVF